MPAAYYVQPTTVRAFVNPPNATRPFRIRAPLLALLFALMPVVLHCS